MLLCLVFQPCLESGESSLIIAECIWFLRILIIMSIKCSGIMCLTSDINTNHQSFFVIAAIFSFCVLRFILDTSLFNKITNRSKSVILFYTEVFFSQSSFSEFLIFKLYRNLLFIYKKRIEECLPNYSLTLFLYVNIMRPFFTEQQITQPVIKHDPGQAWK